MTPHEKYIEEMYERAHEYMSRSTPLKEIIEAEGNFDVWRVENTKIMYAMETYFATIPYGKYCIVVYNRYNPFYYEPKAEDPKPNRTIGEFAIYEQIPDEGYDEVLTDSLNYAADFRLRYVSHNEYPNSVEAIIKAKEIIDIWNTEGR